MADYVSKYSGSEVDGILDDAIELPESSYLDVGKVLTVQGDGNPGWDDVFPDYDSSIDYGKVLMVTTGTNPITWSTVSSELPSYGCSLYNGKVLTADEGSLSWSNALPDYDSYNDCGKVLMITESSNRIAPRWETPSSGGVSIPSYDNSNNSNDEGKILTILNNGTLDWLDAPSEIPTYAFNDVGKVLTLLDDNGPYVGWGELQS